MYIGYTLANNVLKTAYYDNFMLLSGVQKFNCLQNQLQAWAYNVLKIHKILPVILCIISQNFAIILLQ